MSKIPVSKTMIPYNFDISLGDEMFNIALGYNASADMFTAALSKGGTVICAGAPLIYGRPLFEQLRVGEGYPAVTVIPWGPSGTADRVTWDNFGDEVQLYVDDGEEPVTDTDWGEAE